MRIAFLIQKHNLLIPHPFLPPYCRLPKPHMMIYLLKIFAKMAFINQTQLLNQKPITHLLPFLPQVHLPNPLNLFLVVLINRNKGQQSTMTFIQLSHLLLQLILQVFAILSLQSFLKIDFLHHIIVLSCPFSLMLNPNLILRLSNMIVG